MTVKQVAVTGASRGIGKAIAQRFLSEGWRVWALARTKDSVADLKGDVHFVPFDAASEASVLEAAKTLTTQAGHLTALVNNAGISLAAPLHKTSTEEFARIQHVNVTAPFLLIRELSGAMVKAGHGRIINIASTAGTKGFKYTSAYCASKHALLGLTRSLANEFATRGVTVNAVSPGWTETDMFTSAVDKIAASTGRAPSDARETLEKMNPMHRAVKPEEVADVVFFLASSPGAAAITGANYAIDAGETV